MSVQTEWQPRPSPTPRARKPPVASARGAAALTVGLVVSLLAGTAQALQSRVNGELGHAVGDPYGAALVSFSSAFLIILAVTVMTPAGRRGASRIPEAVKRGKIPWWYLGAGVLGGFMIVTQAMTTVVLGLSVYILGLVFGKSVGSLIVDRFGVGPGGVKYLTGYRVVGTAIIIVAALVAMAPRFAATNLAASLPLLVLFATLSVLAGCGNAIMTAWNAGIGAKAGTPITPTLTNFAAGTLALIVTVLVARGMSDPGPWVWPGQWWLYTGGILGIIHVAASSVLPKHFGVLETSLGMVAGMLISALVLDVLVPTPNTIVTAVTIVGTLVTLVGLVVVTLPWQPRRQN
ncbi:DMT family transporter [Kocuria sp. cx-455]|uniref:DMT family transporter n=1 Tax=Kocuria sp. cx-455 TaxID=2771377 RepID=UPI001687719C|nr:DMT family transporter [Kocuria sp. cx-455]MBD2765280.1 DMT family transporter [Kocuria sp. cx-455]